MKSFATRHLVFPKSCNGATVVVAASALLMASAAVRRKCSEKPTTGDANDEASTSRADTTIHLRLHPPPLAPSSCRCDSPSASTNDPRALRRLNIQRSRTLRILSSKAQKRHTLASLYRVDWNAPPIGSGAFGRVLLATHRRTGERVALKRIPKKLASRQDFQREMEALLRIQKWGGHPHICALREHFDEGDCYYLILDLVEGGEMFDHLVQHGAYSEADAARLVREVASALDFLHGIGVVHNDVKPENLMLSTTETRDGVIQLVDFGCAHVEGEDDDDDDHDGAWNEGARGRGAGAPGGFTPAYSSPEAFERRGEARCLPPVDMWALGVIVYIMLTGVHPFDLRGTATDEEIERDIRNKDLPLPLGPEYSFAKHLSPSARDLIERLMQRDPTKRISAYEMLHHPWVTGETASTSIMAGSDRRLNKFKKFKTKVQTQFFADAVEWSDEAIVEETRRRTSLIERSFKAFDGSDVALKRLSQDTNPAMAVSELVPPTAAEISSSRDYVDHPQADDTMTMSDYSDLLSENMKQRYFPKGHFVYHEGDKGDHMYFINSGTVEVITSDGIKNNRHAGDFFGEGALLHPLGTRSSTIKCKTPVHVIEINREYFEKYMVSRHPHAVPLRNAPIVHSFLCLAPRWHVAGFLEWTRSQSERKGQDSKKESCQGIAQTSERNDPRIV
ncbi:hypothetical protein ACHAWX_005637 [Stephanocyclus meneghinianus]